MLCTATTGLAALNHEGGTTAHLLYKIPVTDGEEAPQCNVIGGSQRAELLRATAMHIWNEFPMYHWKVFEAVSCCLCDLASADNSTLWWLGLHMGRVFSVQCNLVVFG